ncbi:putative methyltransferase NSUN7 isoform X2 [Bolinopsis microptera]|uniref:putative methyltransferase NSUN7 isoform X2 n=1 Tax=Bolinopsis microptera TaxID=2820187 RepID=UPI00307958FC
MLQRMNSRPLPEGFWDIKDWNDFVWIFMNQDPQPQFEEVNTIQRTKRLLPYNHRVMLAASVYLEYIQGQRGLPPQPSYFKTDPYLMRQTYKLALGTFHYIQVIEDLLLDTYFYSSYVQVSISNPPPSRDPQFRQCQSLVAVMLYNLKLLGFKAPRAYQCEFGETVREVQEVHEALLRFKTKFHAAFARCRIKCNAYQEDQLMSNDIRIRYKSCVSTPRHVRVNSLRRNKDQVIMTLENRGYTKIAPLEPWTPFSFYCDPLLEQLLVFSPDSKDDLTNFALVHDGSLLLQDKSTVVAASILHNMISPNGPSSNDDVIVTDIGTGNAACYLAALQSKEGSVLAFGPAPDATEKLLTKSDTLNASNVHIVNEPFLQSSCKDKIFKGVRGILCNPPSSLSGVVDIVELVVEEGEKILPAVAKGPCDTASLPRYVTTQYLTLKHALSFPKVSCVVFFTRSIHPQECEHLVRKVCDELSESSDDSPFRLVPVDSAVRESVLTNDSFYHPLVNMKNIPTDISSKCLRVMPTAELGGFFVATFQRMAVKSSTILERALEKGTLGGDPSKGSSSAKKHKKNKKAAKKLKGDSAMDPTTASMIKVRGKSRKSAKRK